VLQVRGTLTVGPAGRIEANGGHGFGGVGWWTVPGGGGGGGGGTIVLMAGRRIVLHAHGETFANRDYDFAISADGGMTAIAGVSESTLFGPIRSKYPPNGQDTVSAAAYAFVPLGGFGGLGTIQLMVPVGTNNPDGTNTVLDDAISIVRNGVELQGPEKQRYLGWRGFAGEGGVHRDDFGAPTGTIGGQGDLRPDPILMPVPFASNGRARARSPWLPLGGLFRRPVAAPDGLPRAVVGAGLQFARHARADGWLPFDQGRLVPPASAAGCFAQPIRVESVTRDAAVGGGLQVARLASALPDTAAGAYTGRLAVFGLPVGAVWSRAHVVASADDTLSFEPAANVPAGTFVQVYEGFADLAGAEPDAYTAGPGLTLPRANARIGFAFHRDPAHAAASGDDPGRFPPEVDTWLFDLSEPSVRSHLQNFGPRFLQWDVLLDGEFGAALGGGTPPADAGSAIALQRFWLPVRY
jgi:hypothetical protein